MSSKGYFLLRFAGVSTLAVAAGIKAMTSFGEPEEASQKHQPAAQARTAKIVGDRPNNPKFLYVENVIKTPDFVSGHTEFCDSNADSCEISDAFATIAWDDKNRALIEKINADVNARITYKKDIENYGVTDKWAYPDGLGDCEDYVLEKRRELIIAGFPPAALLTAYVTMRDGSAHAVLIVRSDMGDKVLDNAREHVADLNDTPYNYKYATDPLNSRQWREVTYVNMPEPKGDRLMSVGGGKSDRLDILFNSTIIYKTKTAFSPVGTVNGAAKFNPDRWGVGLPADFDFTVK